MQSVIKKARYVTLFCKINVYFNLCINYILLKNVSPLSFTFVAKFYQNRFSGLHVKGKTGDKILSDLQLVFVTCIIKRAPRAVKKVDMVNVGQTSHYHVGPILAVL